MKSCDRAASMLVQPRRRGMKSIGFLPFLYDEGARIGAENLQGLQVIPAGSDVWETATVEP